MKWLSNFKQGLFKENPIFVLVLGMCPTLAVTTSVMNAIGMGLATIFVLTCSNILISLLKEFFPDKVRIPCYIVVIASFTTIIDIVMAAFVPDLHSSLGIFIPLIVVNCVILGRAEAFASKNDVLNSMFDGIGMGIGFTGALVLVSSVRELLGEGTLMGVSILPYFYRENPMQIAIMAPGAFITLGLLMAAINILKNSFRSASQGEGRVDSTDTNTNDASRSKS